MTRQLLMVICTFALQLGFAPHAVANSSDNLRYLSPEAYRAVRASVANYPAKGSAAEQADIAELFNLQATRTLADCERANAIVQISTQSFFGAPYGMLSSEQVKAVTPLFEQVRVDLNYFVAQLKTDFARPRPYTYLAGLKPCVPMDASLSYPRGHSTTANLEALVLSSVYPELAEQLKARGLQTAQDRVVGGVHHPSDIQAGEHLAETLFALMIQSPAFRQDVRALHVATHH